MEQIMQCDFCGRRAIESHIIVHEKICYFNPVNRTCFMCKNLFMQEDKFLPKFSSEKCKKGIEINLSNNSNYLTSFVNINCDNFELDETIKTAKERDQNSLWIEG